MITLDDLTVERSTADWGGPIATVTVNAGPKARSVFALRSTEGIDRGAGGPGSTLANGGGIHVDAGEPEGGRPDWRGAFRTFDMDEDLALLVDYVNDLAVRDAVQEATWAETSAVEEGIRGFTDALGQSSRRDWRQELDQLVEAVAALRMRADELAP
jgi:hypothetical protein